MSKIIELEIKDIRGLHARKCLAICQAASKYSSDIQMAHNGHVVDMKSILGLLSLSLPQGSHVEIRANGTDSEEALTFLQQIVE
jgi:phosphocarrier protein